MNYLLSVFNGFLVQVFLFIVVIGVVGYLISLINRVFYTLTGNSAKVCYATGFIGTPIHELAHAAMCLVFFHKIEEMKLFQIGDDGTLGYVNHSYNPRNLYQRVGNYFIGIAPIILGGVVLLFGMKYLMPTMFLDFEEYVEDFVKLQKDGFGFEWFAYALVVLKGMFVALINGIGHGYWYIFFILALCIAIHMNLSGADIKGSLSALPILIAILAVANFGLGILAKGVYKSFVSVMSTIGGYIAGMLMIALAFSILALLLALVVMVIRTAVRTMPFARK
jgi:hypothetical protein